MFAIAPTTTGPNFRALDTIPVTTIAVLKSLRGMRHGQQACVSNYYDVTASPSPTPGGGGLFWWNSASSESEGLNSDSFEVVAADAGGVGRWISINRRVSGGPLYEDSDLFTPSGSGAVARTVQAKLRDVVHAEDFGWVAAGNVSAAIQAAHDALPAAGGTVQLPNSAGIVNAQINITKPTRLLGHGKGMTSLTAHATSLGTANMIKCTSVDGLEISGITFDHRNDAITPSLADSTLESEINLTECKNVSIHHNRFYRSIHYSIAVFATSPAESENLYIHNNVFESGSRGGVAVARRGRNIHVYKNKFKNIVDSAIGGISYEKSISISGTIGVWIHDNDVYQDNGDGGTVIVEYIDRQSEDVHIHNNRYEAVTSTGDDLGYKVGASVRVWVTNNTAIGAHSQGIYMEGCYDAIVEGNYIASTGKNGIIVADDAQTSRVSLRNYIRRNTIKNANTLGAALGTANSVAGHKDSHAIWVDAGDRIYVDENTFVDDGNTFNGIGTGAITNYTVNRNDFSGMNAARIPLDNHFASTGTTWEVRDNIKMRTTDSGTATILNGTSNITVVPNTIIEGSGNIWNVTVIEPLTGTAVYVSTSQGANNQFDIYTRDAAHAAVNVTTDTTFNWMQDLSRSANGVFGMTN